MRSDSWAPGVLYISIWVWISSLRFHNRAFYDWLWFSIRGFDRRSEIRRFDSWIHCFKVLRSIRVLRLTLPLVIIRAHHILWVVFWCLCWISLTSVLLIWLDLLTLSWCLASLKPFLFENCGHFLVIMSFVHLKCFRFQDSVFMEPRTYLRVYSFRLSLWISTMLQQEFNPLISIYISLICHAILNALEQCCFSTLILEINLASLLKHLAGSF